MIKHPDKTTIGYIKNTFAFCGFKFNQQGIINLAKKMEIQFKFKLSQLYEQPVKKSNYIKGFLSWVKGFVDDLAQLFLAPTGMDGDAATLFGHPCL